MKVCYLCNEYPPGKHGGIGTVTQTLARSLISEGHEVNVIGIYKDLKSNCVTENDHGVQVVRLRATKSPIPFYWIFDRIRIFLLIKTMIKNREIDLVEVPDWEGWAAYWPKLPIPVIIRVHGSSSYFQSELSAPLSKTTFHLERASLRRADFWCSVSKYAAQKTKAVFKLESNTNAILYNPVDTYIDDSVQFTRSQKKVVFTGTLTLKKGVVSLINAWPKVVEKNPHAKLDMYGKDGKTEVGESMQSFLTERLPPEIRNSVTFFGHVEKEVILQALKSARVAVFPSFAEAFAMAPLEAMACGCPTIYTKLGPGPELIQDGVNGLLIDPYDSQSIVDAIVSILDDNHLANRLGSCGRDQIRNYLSISKIIPLNIKYYQDSIKRFIDSTVVKNH